MRDAQQDVTKGKRCKINQEKDDEDQREWFRTGQTLGAASLHKMESNDLGEQGRKQCERSEGPNRERRDREVQHMICEGREVPANVAMPTR